MSYSQPSFIPVLKTSILITTLLCSSFYSFSQRKSKNKKEPYTYSDTLTITNLSRIVFYNSTVKNGQGYHYATRVYKEDTVLTLVNLCTTTKDLKPIISGSQFETLVLYRDSTKISVINKSKLRLSEADREKFDVWIAERETINMKIAEEYSKELLEKQKQRDKERAIDKEQRDKEQARKQKYEEEMLARLSELIREPTLTDISIAAGTPHGKGAVFGENYLNAVTNYLLSYLQNEGGFAIESHEDVNIENGTIYRYIFVPKFSSSNEKFTVDFECNDQGNFSVIKNLKIYGDQALVIKIFLQYWATTVQASEITKGELVYSFFYTDRIGLELISDATAIIIASKFESK